MSDKTYMWTIAIANNHLKSLDSKIMLGHKIQCFRMTLLTTCEVRLMSVIKGLVGGGEVEGSTPSLGDSTFVL